MRILVDILHPAHVHFYRNFYAEMTARGHDVGFTARDKDRSIELLARFELPYQQISAQRTGRGLAVEMLQRTGRLMRIMREFDPHVLTGIMGPSIAVAGKLSHTPAVVFYDTEFARQTNRFVYPLAYSVCTPDCYQGAVLGRHITYAGYHELAYLHPNRFAPDPHRLAAFDVAADEPYSVVRFVSWQASHDRRETGLTDVRKRQLIDLLQHHGRVVISSEAPLPADLEALRSKGPVEQIHHLIAHAQLIVGESATMSSEAAVLGVPAVLIATTSRGYIDDQERRYGHVRYFSDQQYEQAVAEIEGLLADAPREMGEKARERLLQEKIDVTSWMVEYFESTFSGV
jgi:predicted glycosyltransferase